MLFVREGARSRLSDVSPVCRGESESENWTTNRSGQKEWRVRLWEGGGDEEEDEHGSELYEEETH